MLIDCAPRAHAITPRRVARIGCCRPGGVRPGSAAPVAIRGPATSAGLATGGGRDSDTRPAGRRGSPRPAHRRRIRGLHAELHRATLATALSILVCPNLFPGPRTAVAAGGGRIAAAALNGIFCQTPALPRVSASTASGEQLMASANAAVAHGLPDRGSGAGGAKPQRPSAGKLLSPNNSAAERQRLCSVVPALPVDRAHRATAPKSALGVCQIVIWQPSQSLVAWAA
jgi:hypothetical protein